MRRIKVSRKILLVLGVLMVILLGAAYTAIPKILATSIDEYEKAKNIEKSMVLQDRLIRHFPGAEEARWETFALADNLFQQEDRIMIGPNFTSGGGNFNRTFEVQEVIVYLEMIAQAQKESMWKYTAYQKLGQLYDQIGNYENAEENYLLAKKGFGEERKGHREAETDLLLIQLYLKTGEFQKALAIIDKSLMQNPQQQRAEFLSYKADVYFQLGDFEQAQFGYQEAMAQVQKDWESFLARSDSKDSNINATLEDQPIYKHGQSRLALMDRVLTDGQLEYGQVQGKIYRGQSAMPNVMVYLINEREYNGFMSNLERISANPPVKTNERGEFVLKGIAPGQYFIALGVVPKDLEGIGRFKGLETFTVEAGQTLEVSYQFQPRVIINHPAGQQTFREGNPMNIAWEKVEGAFSYNLHITLKLENGYVSRVYRKNLKETNLTLNPQGLAMRDMNFVSWGKDYLSPSAILGSFYPGAEIFFVVEALDEQGRSISDSEGYVLQLNGNYPSIQIIETKRFSAGDKLVTEKKYIEAEQAYLEELKTNPLDPYTLLSLARFYNYYGLDGGTSDPSKAMEYYRKLLQVTREKFIVEEAASTAIRPGSYDLALQLFKEIENELEPHSFWVHMIGELYMRLGQSDKALDYYLRYLSGQKEFRDLGPIAAMLYQDKINEAITLLQEKEYAQKVRYNPDGESLPPANIATLIQNLEQYRAGSKSVITKSNFQKYLMELIRIDGNNRFEKINEFESKVKSLGEKDVLVQVLCELARDRR